MRITKTILKNRIVSANETLNTNITNREYNGYNHLQLNGENIFTGSTRECVEFLNGLVQFQLLNR